MKLISCYIAGFGKFSNQTFHFENDLTVIKEDNGWGKTTLADFIRCMLYGQDAGRGKAIEHNERAKYAPWRGGAYGGSLTFSYNGKGYRIERTFGKTPAQDNVRLYDQNNMQCFDFGDRAERLGESIFGVDGDGYRRSVYLPQGEIPLFGVPDTMKGRLLALLNDDGGENTAARALERLEAADRALRAKRKPAQGKLDKIDERLNELHRQQEECDYRLASAKQLRGKLATLEREIAENVKQLETLSLDIERASRQGELALKKRGYEEAREACAKAEGELRSLQEFFGNVPPADVNVEGIERAVAEYYALEKSRRDITEKIRLLEGQYQQFSALKMQKEACEKVLDSYDALLEKNAKKAGAGTSRKEKGKKIIPPKRKSNRWILFLSILVAVGGALLTDKNLYAGLGAFAVGVLGLIFVFFRTLPKRAQAPQGKEGIDIAKDPDFSARYDAAYAEMDDIQAKLAAFPDTMQAEYEGLLAEKNRAEGQVKAQAQGIETFLRNFRFGEIYDYRAAVEGLREKIGAHARCKEELQRQRVKVEGFEREGEGLSDSAPVKDMQVLKREREEAELRRQQLADLRAKTTMEIKGEEEHANKNSLIAEEKELTAEKLRLEKRHRAILSAKSFLLRAKENLAGRYLDPVQRGCQAYLAYFGEGGTERKRLAFDGEGAPVYEDEGAFRQLGYYSEGSKELLGICTRLALVDAVFTKEKPPLILDDPFVNLDDKKTAVAKKLLKELTKRYQIIYLTCKTERAL